MNNEESASKGTETPQSNNKGIITPESKDNITKVKTNVSKTPIKYTLEEINRFCLMRFGSYAEMGRRFGGLSRCYASLVLRGKQKASDKVLFKIANAIDIHYLILKAALDEEWSKNGISG